jgi:(p)ppGpp synthase/HD superfamily hydrolase
MNIEYANPDEMTFQNLHMVISYASVLHESQTRKLNGTPYLGHLLSVAGLVIECGGSPEAATAAVLHDAIEDQEADLEELAQEFGVKVASIVDEVSEFDRTHSWEDRKKMYLQAIAAGSPEANLVSLCDKYHNLSSLHREWLVQGEAVWTSFKAGKDKCLQQYCDLLDIYQIEGQSALALKQRLRQIIESLKSEIPQLRN